MRRRKIDNPNQLSIFDHIKREKMKEGKEESRPGSLCVDPEIREQVSEDLKNSHLSRYEVAAKMSQLIGKEITKTMLDTWTAESKENHRFPAEYLPAFCSVTRKTGILEILCRKVGLFVMPDTEALRAEIKHLEEDIEKKRQEKKKRIILLQEVEGGKRGR